MHRQLELLVSDDGTGMPVETIDAPQSLRNWGIAGMRERATAIGAVLTIRSTPAGTTVTLTVPMHSLRRRVRIGWPIARGRH
jgi:signal transduction histidine kinase